MSILIRLDQNIPIEARDGVRLAADIYRPDDGEKHPAIIVRTPYHSDEVFSFSYVQIMPTVLAGYALVITYLRGRYGSEGQYNPKSFNKFSGPDGYDTIEWIAAQPWCDGNIGMAGESALGRVQWKAACENPPHLKAIAPGLTGAPGEKNPEIDESPVYLKVAIDYSLLIAGDVIDRLDEKGVDTTEIRRSIDAVRDDPSLAYNYLPLKSVPQFNFPGMKETWQGQFPITEQRSEYGLDKPYPFQAVRIPSLNIASWYDPWSRTSFHTFLSMKEKAGSAYAREHQHVFAGPWCHNRPMRALGDIDFGPLADDVGSRAWEYQLSFFDKYLRGKDINLPAVRYFTMGRNSWHEASDWPLPHTDWQRFFLHSHAGANSRSGDGLLSRDEPQNEPPDTYVYNPLHPVPTAGGRGAVAEVGFVTGPIDQIHIERRADVLCYTTSELEQDIEVTGPLNLRLFAATSCRDTDFTAKLVDVYPDGRAYNIADGIVRGRYRNSISQPELLKPGEVTEFVIRLGPTSQLFRRGHRIRIDIASSDFPNYDRNLNTGNRIGEDSEGIPALTIINHQTGYASYIDLPIIPSMQ
jgi:putative CocE/NonD family hydrolase